MNNWNFRVGLHVLIALIVFSPGMPGRTSANETPVDSLIDFPVLVVSNDRHPDQAAGTAADRIVRNLMSMNVTVISVPTCQDAQERFSARKDIGAVVLEWDLSQDEQAQTPTPRDLITFIRDQNSAIPIFLMTGKTDIREIPAVVFANIEGFIRKNDG